MTATQTEMELTTGKAPEVSSADIGLLLNILRAAGWIKAASIATDYRFLQHFPGMKPDAAERKIRAIASASGGQVLSYPGSPGYKLTLEATIEEIQTGLNKLRHQAGEMDRRALELDRVYHCKLRP